MQKIWASPPKHAHIHSCHIFCANFYFHSSAHVLSRAFYRSAMNGGLCLPHTNIRSYLFCLHCSFPNSRLRSSWSLIASFFRVGGATATCLGGDSPTKSSLMLLWDLNFKSQDYRSNSEGPSRLPLPLRESKEDLQSKKSTMSLLPFASEWKVVFSCEVV